MSSWLPAPRSLLPAPAWLGVGLISLPALLITAVMTCLSGEDRLGMENCIGTLKEGLSSTVL